MKILLAEDERSLSRALVKILEKNHYTVDAVYDGQQALEYAEDGGYDVIILDVMMPKANGIHVLEQLRVRGFHTPVLILSAKSEIDDRVLGLDAGAQRLFDQAFRYKRAVGPSAGDDPQCVYKWQSDDLRQYRLRPRHVFALITKRQLPADQ